MRRLPLILLPCAGWLLAACEREERAFRPPNVASESEEKISMVSLSPGPTGPVELRSGRGAEYENNAYHLSQGKKLFAWFNCNGCHGNGGGGSGPPLMDDKWVYGGTIENVVSTIREGRPNGMPSFRGKIPEYQVWQLVAFVQSLSGNVPKDAANGRGDEMHGHKQEQSVPDLEPEREAARRP